MVNKAETVFCMMKSQLIDRYDEIYTGVYYFANCVVGYYCTHD